jgi:cytochrome c551/c552
LLPGLVQQHGVVAAGAEFVALRQAACAGCHRRGVERRRPSLPGRRG